MRATPVTASLRRGAPGAPPPAAATKSNGMSTPDADGINVRYGDAVWILAVSIVPEPGSQTKLAFV